MLNHETVFGYTEDSLSIVKDYDPSWVAPDLWLGARQEYI